MVSHSTLIHTPLLMVFPLEGVRVGPLLLPGALLTVNAHVRAGGRF